MNANEIMTSSPCTCSLEASLADVARQMRDNDCGAVPIVDDGRVMGMVEAISEASGFDNRSALDQRL